MKQLVQRLWKWFAGVLFAGCSRICRLFGKELTQEGFAPFLQFVKFGIVGVSNTAISLLVYYAVLLLNKDWYQIGNAAGFIVSVLNSFYWNSKFVFKVQDNQLSRLVKTFTAYGSNLLLGAVLLHLFIEKLGISAFIAPLINLCITIPLNFVLNKFWVMKKTPGNEKEKAP